MTPKNGRDYFHQELKPLFETKLTYNPDVNAQFSDQVPSFLKIKSGNSQFSNEEHYCDEYFVHNFL